MHRDRFGRVAAAAPPLLLLVAVLAPPSHAAVWPQPTSMNASTTRVPLTPTFTLAVDASTPPEAAAFLKDPITRYQNLVSSSTTATADASAAAAAALRIDVTSDDTAIDLGVDESYTLKFHASTSSTATLKAQTVFGCLRGLETFAQLVDLDVTFAGGTAALPEDVEVVDAPRFAWRGLMIDTARHFYSVDSIKHIIDSMVINKLNVLHMHITDDQSFPLESPSLPTLAQKGAFQVHGQAQTYSHADVADLKAFSLSRGVLLLPEIDMPAHTSSWGAAFPTDMITGAGCAAMPFQHGDTFDVTNPAVFERIDTFLGDVIDIFYGDSKVSAATNGTSKRLLHLGGDEVPTSCWAGSSRVTSWKKQKFGPAANWSQVEQFFVDTVARGKRVRDSGVTRIYWQEVFDNGVYLPPESTIVQSWKANDLGGLTAAGLRVTNSYKWYLNHGCDNFGDGNWPNFYTNDPLHFLPRGSPYADLVLGGEVTMWSECVDASSFDSIVWPRAAAAAEQLWSPAAGTTKVTVETTQRMAEHRCMLLKRGVRAAPINDALSAWPRDTLNAGCV